MKYLIEVIKYIIFILLGVSLYFINYQDDFDLFMQLTIYVYMLITIILTNCQTKYRMIKHISGYIYMFFVLTFIIIIQFKWYLCLLFLIYSFGSLWCHYQIIKHSILKVSNKNKRSLLNHIQNGSMKDLASKNKYLLIIINILYVMIYFISTIISYDTIHLPNFWYYNKHGDLIRPINFWGFMSLLSLIITSKMMVATLLSKPKNKKNNSSKANK